jgi:TRAP-type C4-dicarboxylate transport system substrate-binding protein
MTPLHDRDGWIWMDGEWLPWREARVHVFTHTLHYGMGCFEGVRAYAGPNGTHLFRVDEHTRRLLDSAHVLDIPLSFDADTLIQTQLSITGGNWRQQYAPEYDAITVPFVFATWDEVDAFMESPSGQALVEIAEEKGGIKYFGTQHRGPRHMTANKAIHSPEDLQGFRMRLPSLPVWLQVWEEIGATVVNVPAPEIYLAMQTRQVDGHENSLSSPYTRRLWEVQDHIILTSHVQFPWNWVASKRWWDRLEAEDQALIAEAIEVARLHGTEVERELDEYYLEQLEANGMTIIEPDVEAFREAAMPAIERILAEMADGVMDDALGGND